MSNLIGPLLLVSLLGGIYLIFFRRRELAVEMRIPSGMKPPLTPANAQTVKPVAREQVNYRRFGSAAAIVLVIALLGAGIYLAYPWVTRQIAELDKPTTAVPTATIASAVPAPKGLEDRWAPTTPMWQWPRLSAKAHHGSKMLDIPPGLEIKFADGPYRIHNVDADGNECVNPSVSEACAADTYRYVFLTNDSGDDIDVSWAYAPDKT